MIVIHFYTNGMPGLAEPEDFALAEELAVDKGPCTRIYLKNPITAREEKVTYIDVVETAEQIKTLMEEDLQKQREVIK